MAASVISSLVRQNATGFFFVRPILQEVTNAKTLDRIFNKALEVYNESCQQKDGSYQPVFTFQDMSHETPGTVRMWINRKTGSGYLQQTCYVDLEVVRDLSACYYMFDLATKLDWNGSAVQGELPIGA